MTTTSHNGALYGVERGLLEQMAHYVDGTPLVGGRGTPLADMLADSYRREADELIVDLHRITEAMSDADQATLADRLRALSDGMNAGLAARAMPLGADPQAKESGVFTADFRNGGRPITGEHDEVPDPPVVPAADGSDGDGATT